MPVQSPAKEFAEEIADLLVTAMGTDRIKEHLPRILSITDDFGNEIEAFHHTKAHIGRRMALISTRRSAFLNQSPKRLHPMWRYDAEKTFLLGCLVIFIAIRSMRLLRARGMGEDGCCDDDPFEELKEYVTQRLRREAGDMVEWGGFSAERDRIIRVALDHYETTYLGAH